MDERQKGIVLGFAKTGIPFPVFNAEKVVRYTFNEFGVTAELFDKVKNESGGYEVRIGGKANGGQ